MNEELRDRTIDHTARAHHAQQRNIMPWMEPWGDLSEGQRELWRSVVEPHVVATLCVVADWCDEQAETVLRNKPEMDTMTYTRYVASETWERAAEACRPVGEDQT